MGPTCKHSLRAVLRPTLFYAVFKPEPTPLISYKQFVWMARNGGPPFMCCYWHGYEGAAFNVQTRWWNDTSGTNKWPLLKGIKLTHFGRFILFVSWLNSDAATTATNNNLLIVAHKSILSAATNTSLHHELSQRLLVQQSAARCRVHSL